ncbi:MAG: hypothetical protein IJG84_14345, partial [Kiritimatiellae bacterium]|nr:hypothetical protein [Kiritimatiellia bacterium]
TWLEPLSEAPFPMAVLNDFLKEYSQPGFKAHMMVKEGKLIRLKRGWFCVNPKYSKKSINHGVVANVLYDGPSYVSIETALSYYGLIPERTMGMTSVVTGRSKTFKTPIGWFSYKSIPEDLFPIGVRSVDGYLMASPEKALCDYLYTRKDLRIYSPKTLASYLEEDVRFDFDSFANHDPQIFAAYAACGHKAALFNAAERLFR